MMITLEKFGIADFQRLISWVPDAEFLLQWSGPKYGFPLDEAQLAETLKLTEGRHPTYFIFKAVFEGETVGHIEIMDVDHRKKSAILGRVLIGPHQQRGKGFGRAMIESAIHFAFHELELENLDLGVFKFNGKAISIYSQLGFKIYRTIENNDDDQWTLLRMNLSRQDWRKFKT